MIEERLEQYRALKFEIAQLEDRICNMQNEGPQDTCDSVSTSAEFPYSKHTLVICGIEDVTAYNKRLHRLQSRLARSRAELDELDEYINSVTDAQIRAIMQYKYVMGWRWLRIARKMGFQTESGPRMKIKRFLGMDEMCEKCVL